MKINLKIFDLMINIPRFLTGLSLQLFGSLIYIIFPPPDQNHIVYKSTINRNKYTTLPNFIGQISNSLPSLIHEFSLILIISSWLFYQKIASLIICTCWFLRGCVFELEKIFNSSFIKGNHERKLKVKSLSIFAIFIFFTSIISINVNYHHFVNSIYNDKCLIIDTAYRKADDDSNLSIYDVYQISSNDQIIFISSTKKVFITLYVLVYKISTRAPPG